MDKELLEILVCPQCKGELVLLSKKDELACRSDHLAYPIRNGIPVMLIDEARRMEEDEPIQGS
ncbi:MAG: Trm112 family protein [Magnetococcales bacterium]|nr:Trm112 family protein [Magnetococcales bacterium]